jgi:hypothetical protein
LTLPKVRASSEFRSIKLFGHSPGELKGCPTRHRSFKPIEELGRRIDLVVVLALGKGGHLAQVFRRATARSRADTQSHSRSLCCRRPRRSDRHDIRIGGTRAFYVSNADYIQVPPPAYFEPINWPRTVCQEWGIGPAPSRARKAGCRRNHACGLAEEPVLSEPVAAYSGGLSPNT